MQLFFLFLSPSLSCSLNLFYTLNLSEVLVSFLQPVQHEPVFIIAILSATDTHINVRIVILYLFLELLEAGLLRRRGLSVPPHRFYLSVIKTNACIMGTLPTQAFANDAARSAASSSRKQASSIAARVRKQSESSRGRAA